MDVRTKSALAFLTYQQDRSDDHLGRARRLLERAIRQRWADGMLTRDVEGGLAAAPGAQDIERMMRPPTAAIDVVDDHAYDPASPVGELVETLGLGPTEADLLAVLLACETDPASARLVAYLSGNATTATLTIDTLFEIVYRARNMTVGHATTLLHSDLAPEGPARRLRFLMVDGADSRSFLAQGVRIHPRLAAWMLGRRGLDAELSANARLLAPEPADEIDTDPDPDDQARLAQVVHAFESQRRLVVIHGAVGSGRELLLRAAARALGRSLLLVSGRGLEPHLMVSAFREATLHGALLAFTDADELFATDGLLRLRECLAVHADTVAMTGLVAHSQAVTALRSVTDVTIAVPPHARRLQMWRTQLHDVTTLSDYQWREVAGLYNLGIGGIAGAGRVARELAASERATLGRAHISRAVRQLFHSDLSVVAKRVEVSQTWDDVVLPEDVVETIVGIVDRVSFRNEVLGDWGFGRKVGKGLGLTVLFSGQPGTGKSMVAGLIARELGLDLYVIDLSRVVSKWLGETEKNLARAFDAAEAGHVLLLFDEADSILGKRTAEVRSSNDRHANMETNFILARLEQFAGIAVFTTNIASAIDPAIMRRMSANIAFPFPDVDARAELWRRMIPAEAPVAGPIDFVKLAKQFEMSGGFIRNVVLRAAFLAAREGKPISASHLERSARGEYGDRGALTVGGRLA